MSPNPMANMYRTGPARSSKPCTGLHLYPQVHHTQILVYFISRIDPANKSIFVVSRG
ncbi:hypothetical protein M433DRAFT_158600 [Acidomyces richmondensis BFW]|nr:MAG: hypothetical protein FE78DRAFT_85987 [Acidomyces sp. 'richmondensis']KYG41847.1 hypothetical protein M433DRAFT_158600 [Acidomyces richmondensis BFW]